MVSRHPIRHGGTPKRWRRGRTCGRGLAALCLSPMLCLGGRGRNLRLERPALGHPASPGNAFLPTRDLGVRFIFRDLGGQVHFPARRKRSRKQQSVARSDGRISRLRWCACACGFTRCRMNGKGAQRCEPVRECSRLRMLARCMGRGFAEMNLSLRLGPQVRD
jgi:hypothetical protein